MINEDEELANYRETIDIEPCLKPRDALFGGRTNAAKLHYKCKEGEKIHYYDFTSLYPYVQKNREYPIGVPQIISENLNLDINAYFGVIKCKILSPKVLLYPVLPAKINNKLVFTLCSQCAIEKAEQCDHDDSDRCQI